MGHGLGEGFGGKNDMVFAVFLILILLLLASDW